MPSPKAQRVRGETAGGPVPLSGVDLITNERVRHVTEEGWTPAHDDSHDHGELVKAAVAYALTASHQGSYTGRWPYPRSPHGWPWEPEAFKQHGRIADLAKAGALIAAEIDRLQRAEATSLEGRPGCLSRWNST